MTRFPFVRARLLAVGAAWLVAVALVATRPAHAALCTIDQVPAATLLFPVFEVDLDAPARNTILSVTNVGSSATIAHFTLWTDWAIPVLNFDIYLAGLDTQRIDLADVLLQGRLPATGKAVSPHGPLSGQPVSFANCNNGTTPGQAPVYGDPAIPQSLLAGVRAAFVGDASVIFSGKCAGSDRGNMLARGYVTVEANDQCTVLFPSDPTYFNDPGPTTRRNVLVGDVTMLRPLAQHAIAFGAVPIEAYPEGHAIPAGSRTFYGRYVNGTGADGREPLPAVLEARNVDGGAFNEGTAFFVWRETVAGNPAPVTCGQSPSWAPLATAPVAYFDELEDVVDVSQSFPIALDVQDSMNPALFGRAVLDLAHAGVTPLYGAPEAQAWAGWTMAATNRFVVTFPAAHHAASCAP